MSHIVIDSRIIASSTGRYVLELLKNLEKIDKENNYSVIVRPADRDVFRPKNLNFKIVEADIADFTFAEQFKLNKVLKGLKPDLVHFTMPQQPLIYRGKTVTTIHDLTLFKHKNFLFYPSLKKKIIYYLKYPVYKLLINRVVKKSDAIITSAKYVKSELAKRYLVDPSKIYPIHLAAETDDVKSKEYTPMKGKKYIMYVGRAWPYKNIELVIQAMKQLNKTDPELHLVLVGKKEFNYDHLEEIASKEDIKNIHFTGFIDDNQLNWLYQNTVSYIFPSLSEGFGLPGLEALEQGANLIINNIMDSTR